MVNQNLIKNGVKLVRKLNDQQDGRTSGLFTSNQLRKQALARAGYPNIKRHSLEDRLSTQAGAESQEDDGNTTKSSKLLQNRDGSNEKMLDNVTVTLGETKNLDNPVMLDDQVGLDDITEVKESNYPTNS